jgi:hypothetical protein
MPSQCLTVLAIVLCSGISVQQAFAAASSIENSSQSWRTPEYLDTLEGDMEPTPALNPDIAIDGKGRVLVVWNRYGRFQKYILAKRYEPGRGWSEVIRVHSTKVSALSPKLAVSDSGLALAVWYQSKPAGGAELWANEFNLDKGWGESYNIKNANPYEPRDLGVVMDKTGNGLIVWLEKGEPRCRRFHFGSTMSEKNDCHDRYADHLTAAINNGHGVVAWRTAGDEDFVVTVQRYVSGEGWMEQEPLAAGPLGEKGSGGEPIPVIDQDGNVTLLWAGGPYQSHIYARRYTKTSGTWTKATTINNPELGGVSGVTAIVDGDGAVLVAWSQSANVKSIGSTIWLSKYSQKEWSAPAGLPTNGGQRLFPALASARPGSGIITWVELSGNNAGIWMTRYDKLGLSAAPKQIGGTTLHYTQPKIVEDKEGGAVAIWQTRVEPQYPENIRLCVNVKNRHMQEADSKYKKQDTFCQDSLQHGDR